MTTSRPRGSAGTRAGGSGRPGSPSTESSGADAIRDFIDDMRELLEGELRTAQEELAGKFRVASEGALVLGVAVVLAGLAAGTSTVVIMRMLEKVLSPMLAATVATVVFAVAAGVLASVGVAAVRRALPLVPERALDELWEEVREALPG